MLLLACTTAALASASWADGKPSFFPATIPSPLAYYFMDEGSGMQLKDSVSDNAAAGMIVVVDDHQEDADGQSANHTGANWQSDEYFGTSIACGKIDDTIIQKDTLAFEDVDYGSNGAWSWSVWFRHEKGVNYPGYQREQFFGHGDPLMYTSARHQVHIQFEKSGSLRTILTDGNDMDRFHYPCMLEHCPDPNANPACYKQHPNGTDNPAAYDCWRNSIYKESASTDTDPVIRDYDNGLWHHLVLSTRTDGGPGYNLFVDGVIRAASPFQAGIGKDKGYGDSSYANYLGVGGDPIDPVGMIRFCGRAKPAAWADSDAGLYATEFDHRRYFRGKVAHFSVWSSAMSQDQVNALHKAYVDQYSLTVTPFVMPASIPKPMAYYFLDEGYGFDLKESMTQDSTSGRVQYVPDHQINLNYTSPNWVHDDHFGRTIACGEISNKTHPELGAQQKDWITLADVDYGASGRWAMSVWYRHEVDVNFPNYQREQFFGHGDPRLTTGARNQVHIQFEKDDGILAIVKDSNDADRYSADCMLPWCKDIAYTLENSNCYKEWPNGTTNDAAYACWQESKDVDSATFETVPLAHTDNGIWHNLVMTTNAEGPGLNLYIDGELEARSPYCTDTAEAIAAFESGSGPGSGTWDTSSCVGLNKKSSYALGVSDPIMLNSAGVGGDPIDPLGPMRLCGRLKGGAIWNDAFEIDPNEETFDPKRFFRGQVAHFALWNSALSKDQVNALIAEYRANYDLPLHPSPPAPPFAPLAANEILKDFPAIRVVMRASGSISDYDDTKKGLIETAFVTAAGVSSEMVTITISAGSVVIDAQIVFETEDAASDAESSLAATLETSASATAFLAAASVTVIDTPAVVQTTVRLAVVAPPPSSPPSPPPPPMNPSPAPPLAPSPAATDVGLILGVVFGVIGGFIVIGAIIYYMSQRGLLSRGGTKASSTSTASSTSPEIEVTVK